MPPSKRRRVELTLEDKMKLINDSQIMPKPTLKNTDLNRSTVSDLLKKKDFYTKQWESNANAKKLRFNTGKYDKLNELVWEWFCMARSKSIPVSGPLIQEKASEYTQELHLSEFKASNGWLHSWKNSDNVKGYKVYGESGGVNAESVED